MLSKSTLVRTLIALTTFGVFLICGVHPSPAQDSPSWNETKPKPAARPAPKPAAKPARPRPAPPRRAAASPPPRRPTAPAPALLSAQYRVFKVNDDNTQVEVSPVTIFNNGDRLRFGVKTNEDLFLYIIHQPTPTAAGRLLFPDSRINSGQNLVRKNQEFVMPSGCAPGKTLVACSVQVNASAGKEYFTIILSRDAALDFSSESAASTGSDITPQTITRLSGTPNANPPRRGDTIFSQQITNADSRTSDRIVVRFVLNKRGREVAESRDE